ncbi:lamin tail domain-containing protein [Flavobacterium sp.]|uniref:lamin tail domain-containing protein n=1 Tax=Flavobacterium sp. TaxID=239 RepID=UPI0039E37E94
MKNIINTIFSLFISINAFSQVVITEVYYDTPFLEDIYHYHYQGFPNPTSLYHHIGEYIELYNYTTEDIPLKGWAITDYTSKYVFPDNAIIKSNDFIIVAYGNSNSTYFPTLFPNTLGKEDKIYYQDKIILRNDKEVLTVRIGQLRGVMYSNNLRASHRMNWGGNGIQTPIDNGYEYSLEGSWGTTYYKQSLHLNSFVPNINYNYIQNSESFSAGIATPLSADFVPPTQNLLDIPNVFQSFNTTYTNLTYEYEVMQIINNTCPDNILLINQLPSDAYLDNGKCFNYDNSGNTIEAVDCIIPNNSTDPINPSEYSTAELENFSSLILISPNPTTNYFVAYWTGDVVGKINEIQIFSMGNVLINSYLINQDQIEQQLSLNFSSSGVYIVKFILNTGQIITKNVIKM